jgi:hypothetical protein
VLKELLHKEKEEGRGRIMTIKGIKEGEGMRYKKGRIKNCVTLQHTEFLKFWRASQ